MRLLLSKRETMEGQERLAYEKPQDTVTPILLQDEDKQKEKE